MSKLSDQLKKKYYVTFAFFEYRKVIRLLGGELYEKNSHPVVTTLVIFLWFINFLISSIRIENGTLVFAFYQYDANKDSLITEAIGYSNNIIFTQSLILLIIATSWQIRNIIEVFAVILSIFTVLSIIVAYTRDTNPFGTPLVSYFMTFCLVCVTLQYIYCYYVAPRIIIWAFGHLARKDLPLDVLSSFPSYDMSVSVSETNHVEVRVIASDNDEGDSDRAIVNHTKEINSKRTSTASQPQSSSLHSLLTFPFLPVLSMFLFLLVMITFWIPMFALFILSLLLHSLLGVLPDSWVFLPTTMFFRLTPNYWTFESEYVDSTDNDTAAAAANGAGAVVDEEEDVNAGDKDDDEYEYEYDEGEEQKEEEEEDEASSRVTEPVRTSLVHNNNHDDDNDHSDSDHSDDDGDHGDGGECTRVPSSQVAQGGSSSGHVYYYHCSFWSLSTIYTHCTHCFCRPQSQSQSQQSHAHRNLSFFQYTGTCDSTSSSDGNSNSGRGGVACGRPHGYGEWRDSDEEGETCGGMFLRGIPIGPYVSREQVGGGIFRTSRIGYASVTAGRADGINMSVAFLDRKNSVGNSGLYYGVSEVECCVSGTFYRHFPHTTFLSTPPPHTLPSSPTAAAIAAAAAAAIAADTNTGTGYSCGLSMTQTWNLMMQPYLSMTPPAVAAGRRRSSSDIDSGTKRSPHSPPQSSDLSFSQLLQLEVNKIDPATINATTRQSTDTHTHKHKRMKQQQQQQCGVPLYEYVYEDGPSSAYYNSPFMYHDTDADTAKNIDADNDNNDEGEVDDECKYEHKGLSLSSSSSSSTYIPTTTANATNASAAAAVSNGMERDVSLSLSSDLTAPLRLRAPRGSRALSQSHPPPRPLLPPLLPLNSRARRPSGPSRLAMTRVSPLLQTPSSLSSSSVETGAAAAVAVSTSNNTHSPLHTRSRSPASNSTGMSGTRRYQQQASTLTATRARTRIPRPLLVQVEEVIVFLPGFNSCLQTSLSTYGQFLMLAGYPAHIAPFLYCWPQGSILSYYQTKEASASEECSTRLLHLLSDFSSIGVLRVNIIGHSMGARALVSFFNRVTIVNDSAKAVMSDMQCDLTGLPQSQSGSLSQSQSQSEPLLAYDTERLPRLGSVILVNPEADLADFETAYHRSMHRLAESITVYVDMSDAALFWATQFNQLEEVLVRHKAWSELAVPLGRRLTKIADTRQQHLLPPYQQQSQPPQQQQQSQREHDHDEEAAATRVPVATTSAAATTTVATNAAAAGAAVNSATTQSLLLDIDIINTSSITGSNIDKNRHCYFHLSRQTLEDIRETIVSRKRAKERSARLIRSDGNFFEFLIAPPYIKA